MTHPRTRSTLLLALSAMAWSSASAADPVPVSLAATTRIAIVSKECGQQKAIQQSISDPSQVHLLVAEFSSLRLAPATIQAAKFACAPRLDFFAQDQKLTSILVFGCSALEPAPVRGRQYFTFKGGWSRLPKVSSLLGLPARAACDDA